MSIPTPILQSHRKPGLFTFLGLLILSFSPSLTGLLYPPGAWYQALTKPTWNPPSWIFGPVWTVLYFTMALAAFLILRHTGSLREKSMVLFFGQLGLNALWTPLFLGAHTPFWALVTILILDGIVIATIVTFWKIRRSAGLLLMPYLAWLLFATMLNAALMILN